jgi:hypothetical protein
MDNRFEPWQLARYESCLRIGIADYSHQPGDGGLARVQISEVQPA